MADYKGLSIRFDGDASQLISALRQIDSATERTSSALSRIDTALKLDPNNINLYKLQVQELGKQYESSAKRVKELKTRQSELTGQLRTAKAKLQELAAAGDTSSEAYQTQAKAVEALQDQLSDCNRDLELATVKTNQMAAAQRDAQRQLDTHVDALGRASIALNTTGDAYDRLGGKLQEIGAALSIVSAGVLLGFGRSVVTETEEYGNAISQVGGYLDITGTKLEGISELALQFGKDTQFSATEAANAISELAKGGMTQAEIEAGALDATLQLAAAGGIGLAEAAEVAVQSIKVFGLEAEDSYKVADALAGAANKSTAEIDDLTASFRYVSGWAGLANYSINDVAGALGLLADNGLQGEMAGTGLRNVLQRLAAPTDVARKVLEKYGLSAYDSEGKVKPLTQIVEELGEAFKDVDEETRNADLNTVFGARALPAAIALMSAGKDELLEYIAATERAGYANEMAQAKMGDLGWALELLRGEAETAAVNFGNALVPSLINLANAAEKALGWFNELGKSDQATFTKWILAIVAAGPGLVLVGTALRKIGALAKGLGAVASFGQGIVSAFKGGATAMEALAGGMTAAGASAQTLSSGMMLLQGSVILLGVAAAAFIGFKIWDEWRKDKEHAEKLQKATSGLRDAINKTSPKVDAAQDSFDGYRRSADRARQSVDDLIEAQGNLADTISSRNSDAQSNIDQLEWAKQTIEELGTSTETLSQSQLGDLYYALSIVNDEFDTNIRYNAETKELYDEQGSSIDTLIGNIDRLIEARQRELQAEAIQENMKDLYKQQGDLAYERMQKEKALAGALETKKQLEQDLASGDWIGREGQLIAEIDRQKEKIDELTGEINDLDSAQREVNDGIEYYRDQLGGLLAEEEQRIANLTAAIGGLTQGDDELAEHIRSLMEPFPDLIERLDEAGIAADTFSRMSQEDFAQMLDESGGDIKELIGLIQQWNEQNPAPKEMEITGDASGVEEATDTAAEKAEEVDSMEATVTMDGDTKPLSDAAQRAADLVEGVPPEYTVKLTAIDYISDAVARAKAALASLAGSYTRNPYNHTGGRAAGGIRTHAEGGIAAYAGRPRYHAGGSIVNVPGTGYPLDWVGEAGAEAIVPLTNRRYSQPFVDLIADGVSRRMGAGTSYNLYINGARVNDDPQIRGQFIDLMTTLARKGAMNVGHS